LQLLKRKVVEVKEGKKEKKKNYDISQQRHHNSSTRLALNLLNPSIPTKLLF